MKQFLREYRIELVAVLMALLGIFLLVERMQIRVTILRVISLVWRSLSETVGAVVRSVVYRILHITVSDLIGLVLIVLSIVIVLWRMRVRLLQRLTGSTCPVCGGSCAAAAVTGWIACYLYCCRWLPTAVATKSAAGKG
jgi:hypothetical protein